MLLPVGSNRVVKNPDAQKKMIFTYIYTNTHTHTHIYIHFTSTILKAEKLGRLGVIMGMYYK